MTSLIDWDITTAGGALTGFHYTTGTTTSFSSLPGILVVETSGLEHLLQVTFEPPGLAPPGTTMHLGQFDSFEQDQTGTHRQILAGSAVVGAAPVPEPSTIALLAMAGLGLVGFARRRRNH